MANNRRLLFLLTGWAAFSLFFAAWLWFSWGGVTTTQSFDDIGDLTAVPLAVAGVLSFPAAPSKATSLARTVLDGLMIGGSLLIISWSTVLYAVYRASSGSMLSDLISLAYPIGDVVIGTILVIF